MQPTEGQNSMALLPTSHMLLAGPESGWALIGYLPRGPTASLVHSFINYHLKVCLLGCSVALFPETAWRTVEMPPRVLTWVDAEEPRGAAEVLPGQRWVSLEVLHEDSVQSFGHVDSIQDIWV